MNVAKLRKDNPSREIRAEDGLSLRLAVFPGGEQVLGRLVALLEKGGLRVARSPRTPLVPVVGDEGDTATYILEVSDPQVTPPAELSARRPLSLAEAEAAHLRRVLGLCNGNRTRAAAALRIARSTLIRKLQEIEVLEKHR